MESAEQLLVSREWPTSGDLKAYVVKSNAWPAEYFLPSLPANAISWKITRVKVKLVRNGTNTGTLTLQVKAADASKKPTGDILDSGGVDVTTLSTTRTWMEFPFSALAGLDPTSGMCVLVTTTSSQPGVVEYDTKGPNGTMAWCISTDQGASWGTPATGTVMEIYVYGTVTTQP